MIFRLSDHGWGETKKTKQKVEDTEAVIDEGASSSSASLATTFTADEKAVRILRGVRPAQSVRPVGHDVVEGTTVMEAGEVIRAAEVKEELVESRREVGMLSRRGGSKDKKVKRGRGMVLKSSERRLFIYRGACAFGPEF